jgi:hypothetical protein
VFLEIVDADLTRTPILNIQQCPNLGFTLGSWFFYRSFLDCLGCTALEQVSVTSEIFFAGSKKEATTN